MAEILPKKFPKTL